MKVGEAAAWRRRSLRASSSRHSGARCPNRPRVQRRGADPLPSPPRGGGNPAAGKNCGGREGRARAHVTAMVEFRMPSLGADMEAGTLVEWLVKPGDRVKRGEIVAVVETQKG